jgi:hypothetical protein
MRFSTLVIIPLALLLLGSSNQTKPVFIDAAQIKQTKIEEASDRQEAASRSSKRLKFASPAYNKAYAKKTMAEEYKWGSKQYDCLVKLWNKESNWRVNADNPNSSAYGIPQALPGKKMGKGWKTDPHVQINWGLKYIQGRYDTPCGAWSAFRSKGWY